jgi:uncharacterized protein (DUF4415 family)
MLLKTKSGRSVKLPSPDEDAAINKGIAADPDTYELNEAEFKRLKLVRPRGRPAGSGSKIQLTLGLDAEIVEAFKQRGDGWQTKMNDALRDWLKAH